MKTSVRQQREKGFALPIAIGVGVIMILIATTMIIRSNQSQVASLSQRSSNQSLAAVESSVTQFLSLFNKYRVFAASGTGTSSSSWDNLRKDINALPGCADFAQSPTDDPSKPNYDPEAAILDTLIDDFDAEINVDPTASKDPKDPEAVKALEKGSYQLKSYEVNGAQGILRLSGKASDKRGTSITDLEVKFPVDRLPVQPSIPGESNVGCSRLATSIPFNTSNTLPFDNVSDLLSRVENKIPSDQRRKLMKSGAPGATPSDLLNKTLPLSGDKDGFTYILDGQLDINNSKSIEIESGKTVFFVTNSDINIDNGDIKIGINSSLYIISSANVSFISTNEKSPPIFSESYGSSTKFPLNIFLLGEGQINVETPNLEVEPLPIMAFAPFGTVNLQLGEESSPFKYEGEVWAKIFSAPPASSGGSPIFTPRSTSPLFQADTTITGFWDTALDVENFRTASIRPINSWKRIRTP